MSHTQKNKKAVVLLSGGMDSATCLAIAKAEDFDLYAISFNYGQRHAAELDAAQNLAKQFSAKHQVINIDIGKFGGSALTDYSLDVPVEISKDETSDSSNDIPVTYVPARNTVFLSYALAWAEVLGAQDIFIGVNAVDYSGYPDCRPEFIKAYETMANLATKVGVEGQRLTLHTPLIDMTKGEIIKTGHDLGVDYSQTVTCYQANDEGKACGNCDACRLRKIGFIQAKVADSTVYK